MAGMTRREAGFLLIGFGGGLSFFSIAAIVYFVLCYLMSQYATRMERRLGVKRGDVKVKRRWRMTAKVKVPA